MKEYLRMPAFKDIVFDQFKTQLRAHRKQVKEKLEKSSRDKFCLAEDRKKFPRYTHNSKGEKMFAWDEEAKAALREDIVAKKHMQMAPAAL